MICNFSVKKANYVSSVSLNLWTLFLFNLWTLSVSMFISPFPSMEIPRSILQQGKITSHCNQSSVPSFVIIVGNHTPPWSSNEQIWTKSMAPATHISQYPPQHRHQPHAQDHKQHQGSNKVSTSGTGTLEWSESSRVQSVKSLSRTRWSWWWWCGWRL